MSAQLFTHTHITAGCPHCGGDSGQRFDQLVGTSWVGRWAGSWFCDACGAPFRLRLNEDGTAETAIDQTEKKHRVKTWVLLRVPSATPTVWLVVDYMEFREHGETPESRASHNQYFFDEHTCPTNWTARIEAVIHGEDDDPHGVATYVRSVDQVEGDDEPDWRVLFPEAFQDDALSLTMIDRDDA